MALEVIYEGQIDGTHNADPTALASAGVIVPGRICALSKGGGATKVANTIYFETLTAGTDHPAGLVADSDQDVIASGKVSFYTTQGIYKTDQTSGAIVKDDTLSYTATGLLTQSGTNIVAICEDAADSAGMIKIKLL